MPGESEPERMNRLRRQVAAQFPLVVSPVLVGTRVWNITAVQNVDALLDGAEGLAHFPYGFLLWEAAIGLARYLDAHVDLIAGRSVLEIGAGVGLPGLVARALGAQVTQTDHQIGALALAEVNAFDNDITGLERFVADWRLWQHPVRYDVLIGADVMYERAMYFYLEQVFRLALKPGGVLLLSDPGRPQAMDFAAHLENAGWTFSLETQTVIQIENGHENAPVEVGILTARL